MKAKQTYSVELEVVMQDFLEQMVQEYQLPDTGKAIRCLINYAREEADKRSDIFEQIRCLDC